MVHHTSRPMFLALIDAVFVLSRRRAYNALTVDEIILKKIRNKELKDERRKTKGFISTPVAMR